MTAHSGIKGSAAGLTDRFRERGVLDRFVAGVRAGEGRALVVRGEAGVGKTVLLDYLAGRASGCRVVRAAGVQSEMELAFAGLQQLCAPMLDRLDRLPVPQRDALWTGFGLRAGPAPDRFLVGLAVLSLLSEAAEELAVGGLREAEARALLDSALTGPLDERVRGRLVAETRGNPLALLELPRELTPAELAGGFGLPDAPALSGRIEDSFGRRLAGLSAETQRLLLVAAADPVGDPVLV